MAELLPLHSLLSSFFRELCFCCIDISWIYLAAKAIMETFALLLSLLYLSCFCHPRAITHKA